jgi:hypothetical protein
MFVYMRRQRCQILTQALHVVQSLKFSRQAPSPVCFGKGRAEKPTRPQICLVQIYDIYLFENFADTRKKVAQSSNLHLTLIYTIETLYPLNVIEHEKRRPGRLKKIVSDKLFQKALNYCVFYV